MAKPKKQAWPTKAAMAQVYEQHLWGGEHSKYYSGEGSHLPELVDPYIEAVSSFLSGFKTPPIVCDLGCGDFHVGSQLVELTQKYVAVDIVEELISHNQRHFEQEHLEFRQLDLAKDPLPKGDVALIRQVLQHLSNNEVACIAKKLKQFNYVILTEHIPLGSFTPNLDIISGQGTRLKQQSGVDLLAPPFSLAVKASKPLVKIPSKEKNSVIVTLLFELI